MILTGFSTQEIWQAAEEMSWISLQFPAIFKDYAGMTTQECAVQLTYDCPDTILLFIQLKYVFGRENAINVLTSIFSDPLFPHDREVSDGEMFVIGNAALKKAGLPELEIIKNK